MTARDNRPDGREAERAKIVEAAYRLLAVDGASASVTDILAQAGLGTRAFHRLFDSTDELLLTMFRSDGDCALGDLEVDAALAPNGRIALHGWISALLRVAADPKRRPRVFILLSDEVMRAQGDSKEREHYDARQETGLKFLLDRGRRDGSLPRADTADAQWVRALMDRGFEQSIALPEGADVSHLLACLIGFIDRALCKQAPDFEVLSVDSTCVGTDTENDNFHSASIEPRRGPQHRRTAWERSGRTRETLISWSPRPCGGTTCPSGSQT
ncbi:TetR/AcrR family transcriptional regulator [Rhodococcus koreensis]|uniref:TetR/AcrR family transcriptional regulator n=1 Tax=Rhodococcus koreensis TaxID=99653 RepID=UPI0036DC6D34